MSESVKTLPLVFEEPQADAASRRVTWPTSPLPSARRGSRSSACPASGPASCRRTTSRGWSTTPTQMTDLPAGPARRAGRRAAARPDDAAATLEADRGTTRKTLWKLFDGALVESVLMRYPGRVTMCVSSQAGCGMACPFCATGQGGLQRNMSTGEIVEQVVAGARALARGEVPGGPGRISNVVFMGMGEPMANYKAVIGAVRRLTDPAPDGLGMSARGITVSTVGLVPRINQLAEEGIPVTLALSLHAPDDELRDELVPINTRWKVGETVEAAWNYAKTTKRRVSIEYAMMRGINDQAWRADLLGDVLNSYGDWGWVHVNLIPLNPTPGSKWTASDPARRARVRPPARGEGHPHHGARHPRPRDRRRLRPARRARGLNREQQLVQRGCPRRPGFRHHRTMAAPSHRGPAQGRRDRIRRRARHRPGGHVAGVLPGGGDRSDRRARRRLRAGRAAGVVRADGADRDRVPLPQPGRPGLRHHVQLGDPRHGPVDRAGSAAGRSR